MQYLHIRTLVCVSFFVISFNAMAKRELVVSPYNYVCNLSPNWLDSEMPEVLGVHQQQTFTGDLTLDRTTGVGTIKNGSIIRQNTAGNYYADKFNGGTNPYLFGMHIYYQITLTNSSDKIQTGSVRLKKGSFISAHSESSTPGITYWDREVALCGEGKDSPHAGVLTSNPTTQDIGEDDEKILFLNWTLPAKGSTRFTVGAYFWHKFSAYNFVWGALQLSPNMIIEVNEDRGAILGGFSVQSDQAWWKGTKTCGKGNDFALSDTADAGGKPSEAKPGFLRIRRNENCNVTQSFPLNAGRAF